MTSDPAGNVEEVMIDVRSLTKVYPIARSLMQVLRNPLGRGERTPALRGIDLSVGRGEVFGLLGPNGAGKTTFLKILANLVTPTTGDVRIAGRRLVGDSPECRRLVGFVPSDERSFFWRLNLWQNLLFFASLYEVPREIAVQRIESYLTLFGLDQKLSKPFAVYSSGQKKVCSIIRGLLADPPIIVLDEPTNSLDPSAARRLMRHVRDDLADAEGRTVVWATHRLEEVNEICDSVMLISAGECRFRGNAAEFAALSADSRESGLAGLAEVFEGLANSP